MADLADLRTAYPSGLGSLVGIATSTVSGDTASVNVGGTVVTVRVARGLTLAVNDPVLVVRQGSMWWAVGRLGASTPTPPTGGIGSSASPDIRPAVITGTTTYAPTETRSRGDAAWRMDTEDVAQGDYGAWGNHTGVAFYGDAPQSLAGATVTAARVWLRRIAGGTYAAQTLTVARVTESTRPSGAPTVAATTAGPALAVTDEGAYTVPTAYAQALVDGSAGGLGVYAAGGTPYVRLAGRGSWGPAWTLVIDWRR